MRFFFHTLLCALLTIPAFSQCKVKNYLSADDVLNYYIDFVPFYWTATKELKGGAVTDEQNYFLALKPKPFPPKQSGVKFNDDLKVILSNGLEYKLKHIDTRYRDADTSIMLLYVIPEKILPDFRNFEVEQLKMMMGEEGERTYTMKLHKSAVKEQLDCLIESLKKK